jgi:hypothetical protein
MEILMEMPTRIAKEIEDLAEILGDSDDWMALKRLLLLQLPPKLRTNFSTRDPKTKEQSLNIFEREIIKYYKKLTGVQLVLKQ